MARTYHMEVTSEQALILNALNEATNYANALDARLGRASTTDADRERFIEQSDRVSAWLKACEENGITMEMVDDAWKNAGAYRRWIAPSVAAWPR